MSNESGIARKPISRRRFIRSAGAAVGAFTIVPRHVLGGRGYVAANDKLNIAVIGIGGKGKTDTRELSSENIVALCDVDFGHAAKVFEEYPKVKRYKDYRRMLDKQKDIDAVSIATPDHTHAVISMDAMKRGKHVYCQKPLTQTIEEAQLLRKTARRMNVATQMGNQGQAGEERRRIEEMITDDAIGEVTEVHVWTNRPIWPQGVGRPNDHVHTPDDLDWDLWLGPAAERPYNPAYHPFKWRGWWDFGTGALGDMGCHNIDPIFRALKLRYPLTVQATSTPVNKETYPSGSMVTYEFGARGLRPPVTVTWYDGGLKPLRPAELEDGRQMGKQGTLYVGEKGKILDGRVIPESKMKLYGRPPKTIARSPGHYIEWIEACKGGEPGGANFDFAGPLTETVLMGNVALRMAIADKMSRQRLHWDADKGEFSNMPEANEFLRRPYRAGWSL